MAMPNKPLQPTSGVRVECIEWAFRSPLAAEWQSLESAERLPHAHTNVWLSRFLRVNLHPWRRPDSSGTPRRMRETKKNMESPSQKPRSPLLTRAA